MRRGEFYIVLSNVSEFFNVNILCPPNDCIQLIPQKMRCAHPGLP